MGTYYVGDNGNVATSLNNHNKHSSSIVGYDYEQKLYGFGTSELRFIILVDFVHELQIAIVGNDWK